MRRLTLAFLLSATTALATELPVRSVTLSSAGLAQVERAGEVPADGSVTFRAPTDDVDDLLRSLIVVDTAGTVEGLRLPARDLAGEAFRGLPLRPDDFESRVRLLSALRGQEAEAGGARGRIADAAEVPPVAGTPGGLRLTLITPTGLRTVVLREGDEVTLTDTGLAARVARAAEALAAARSNDERRIEIRLRADRARQVAVLYVAGAPLWKPSYRLLVPPMGAPAATPTNARLQGWAVVENGSGSDWDSVRLALVSGEAAAFRQRIYDPITVARPEMPVRVAGAVMVTPDTGGRPVPIPAPAPAAMPPAMVMAAPAPQMAARARAPDAPGAALGGAPAPPATAATAEASAGRVAFVLAEPVTIRAGETANVPFLDVRLPAERVWWIQDLTARYPLQAVRIRNASQHTLPDGLATVYGAEGPEAGVFLGDAEIRAMPAGDGRILAFARDRDVQFSQAGTTTERPVRIALRRGFVAIEVLRREETAVAIDPRGARGTLVIDVPRRPGADPRFTIVSEGDFGLRHEVVLDGSAQTLRLPFERTVRQDIPLYDTSLGEPMLLRWQQFDIEQNLRRLPGGPGTMERLQEILARTPEAVPGRADLAAVVEAMGDLRRLLDEARLRARTYRTADQALARARQAAEDRTGPEQQEARRRLNQASREADAAGTAADQAWEAWQRGVVALLQRGS
ncbi:DUF4139 domain-containing protein [Roseomonas fluvialis]|uniref:DUF4139 domain-containing protein n=1 Tax=Roseomonas fluvialis TaxID=1750527 RepID=A0ABM7Y2P2_9PROT|nr:DUF4139 domain-containing protein [Roseomonas fluvialis]BDG72073.1 hypothetical protein Rmf_20020 [Roseomonas fluvialis]